MKILIAGDIHGSSYYCDKLISLASDKKVDKIILTGDILYHGPRNDLPKDYDPKKVTALLNQNSDKILSVRGNCEAEVDQMLLDFPVMSDYVIVVTEKTELFITHGHIYNNENIPSFVKKGVFVNGHTHIPVCESQNGVLFINPGSVSIPKENSCHSAVIVENDNISFYNIENGEIYMQKEIL